jgi:putative methionine-R-sulfoxide reductase with GAF domain
VSEPKSFDNPEFLKDLEFIDDQLSKANLGQDASKSQAKSDVTKTADAFAAHAAEEDSSLIQELEQACLDTGATGAAIALVRGEEIVCQASAGPQAPSIGARLDPRAGLSGACIQTRKLQQCNDTQTDSRVDAEACRRLEVRSVMVLPLLDGDELFGICEILSSLPNAFGQPDLDRLQALANRIVEGRKQNSKFAATVPSIEPGFFEQKLAEVVPLDKGRSSKSASELPRLEQRSKKNDRSTTVLGVLVIASSMLLGMLVGWRLGWQKATLGLRASLPSYRAYTLPKNTEAYHAAFPVKKLKEPSSSAGVDECGQSGAANLPALPQNGGLTVCEKGRVIFRLPASSIRNLQTSQNSSSLKPDIARR